MRRSIFLPLFLGSLLWLAPVWGQTPVVDLPLDARAWLTYAWNTQPSSGNSRQMKFPLGNTPDGDLLLVFPDADAGAGWLSYLYSRDGYDVRGATQVRAEVTLTALSGTPTFVYPTANNPCIYPPHMRLFLFASPASGHWNDPQGRWWSNPLAEELRPGVFTLTTPLDPAYWSGVYGQAATETAETLAGFNAVKANGQLGMTFGGGCFFGHGVGTSGGTVLFDLSSFTAE
jgi:hypothetical protein